MKKLLLIILICLSILLIPFILNFSKPHVKFKSNNINGAYISKTSPYTLISFDELDNCTFYFYYPDDGKQKLDKGKYSHEGNNIFLINNSTFINQKIYYQNNSFEITINGTKHIYEKIDAVPIIILTPDTN